MTITETLIYLEENIIQLKNRLISPEVNLAYTAKRSLEIDIDKMNMVIIHWMKVLEK